MYSLFCRSECLVAASETTAMVVDKSASHEIGLKHSTDQAVLTLFENFCFQVVYLSVGCVNFIRSLLSLLRNAIKAVFTTRDNRAANFNLCSNSFFTPFDFFKPAISSFNGRFSFALLLGFLLRLV